MAVRQAVSIQIQDLEAKEYKLKLQVRHSDWQMIFQEATKKKSKIIWLYYLAQIVFFSGIMILMFRDFPLADNDALSIGIRYILYGLIGAMAATPLHETIHFIMMKAFGASEVDFKVKLKSFSFAARSHGLIMTKGVYRSVTIMPFIVINLVCLALALILPKGLNLSMVSLGFLHTILSASDFGIMSFLEESGKKELLTLEDVENEVTYFFEK